MPSATQASASMRLRTRGFISLAASSRSATGSAFSWRGRGLRWPSHLASVGAKPSRLTSRSHVLTAPGRTCAERAASSIGRPESVISITSRRARTSGLTGPARAEAISRRVSSICPAVIRHLKGLHRRSRKRDCRPDWWTRFRHRSTVSGVAFAACAASSIDLPCRMASITNSRLRTLRRFSFASAAAISSRLMSKAFRSMGALGNA